MTPGFVIVVDMLIFEVPSNEALPNTCPVKPIVLDVTSLPAEYTENPIAVGSIHVGACGLPRDSFDLRIYPVAVG